MMSGVLHHYHDLRFYSFTLFVLFSLQDCIYFSLHTRVLGLAKLLLCDNFILRRHGNNHIHAEKIKTKVHVGNCYT